MVKVITSIRSCYSALTNERMLLFIYLCASDNDTYTVNSPRLNFNRGFNVECKTLYLSSWLHYEVHVQQKCLADIYS